ncbi:MAG: DMT family transporter [Bacteroidales bacterium]|nr:DMT family transporter [Bacteroidales bacterium]MDD4602887.1 DMT family transporter [Bacteroidales bacterium]
MVNHIGEFAALLTAIFWTVTALAFEAASKKLGSLVVNLLRLFVGFTFLSIFVFFYRGILFPIDATPRAWFILSLSGLVGFVLGDLCLFQAFVVIGARVAMLMMALSPPLTALIGWIVLGETLQPLSWLGMALTVSGIALVVLKKHDPDTPNKKIMKMKFNYPIVGLLLGFGGALGQAGGLVLSKIGMKGYDTFAATQIRVIAGIAGFSILFFILHLWKELFHGLTQKKPMLQLSLGAFFGPFLGVSFSLIAIKYADTGVAATIMALVPIFIIPPSMLIYKEKITFKEIAGAILAVSGVALFFL